MSEGMTIHKSQGQTMETVAVKIESGLERSLLYVALSRATKIDGLYLIGEFKAPKKPDAKHQPTNEMKRLRENAALVPKFSSFRAVPDDVIQIVSHNVQSLRKHISTILNDKIFTKSNLLLLQECWNLSHDKYEINGMAEIQRNALAGTPSAKGTMIYARDLMSVSPGTSKMFEHSGQHIELTTCTTSDLVIVNIYKNPKSSLAFFKSSMDSIKELLVARNVLLCGDLNENLALHDGINGYLKEQFDLDLLSPLKPTTDAGTTIDGIFGRILDYQVDVTIYESYSSYHKPLIVRFQRNVMSTGLSQPFLNIVINHE